MSIKKNRGNFGQQQQHILCLEGGELIACGKDKRGWAVWERVAAV